MRIEDLAATEARFQALIAVIERSPALRKRKAGQLRRLRGLAWATRIVRQRLQRAQAGNAITLGWRPRAA